MKENKEDDKKKDMESVDIITFLNAFFTVPAPNDVVIKHGKND